jgi:broad specificity phosphatase PhoE
VKPSEKTLVLVKHSRPDTNPEMPPGQWRLNDEGRRRCGPLVDRLQAYLPASIYSSEESKARETAALVADNLKTNPNTLPGLEEHHRYNDTWIDSAEDFDKAIKGFFDHPDELVYGDETANQALKRFESAIQKAIVDSQESKVIVVCHGTVISLFLAHHTDVEPMDIWRRLSLSSFVVLKYPEYELLDIVTDIT